MAWRRLPALLSGRAVLIEQNDEWLVSRRYLSEESLALVLDDTDADATTAEGVIAELQAA